jgi:hypothetical protein
MLCAMTDQNTHTTVAAPAARELTPNAQAPCSRRDRWISLCDLLSEAVLDASREALTPACPAADRLDAMKEIVTVAHRLFALERALADTPQLAGDGVGSIDLAAFQERLDELLRTTDGCTGETSAGHTADAAGAGVGDDVTVGPGFGDAPDLPL